MEKIQKSIVYCFSIICIFVFTFCVAKLNNTRELQTIQTNGTLENIDKDNEALKGLIDYASEGAGNVKIGIKGYRKKVSTKDNPVEIEIDEAVFESDSKEIIHIIQKLFN